MSEGDRGRDVPWYSAAHFERVVRELARRIRPVCPHLAEASFDAMIREMARVQLKYTAREEAQAILRLEQGESG